jgi:hypothetical protein
MRGRPCLPLLLATLVASASAPAQAAPGPTGPATERFGNRNHTFHIELPAGWRQIAPNEARKVGERPQSPPALGFAQPLHYYAVGPVDRWLAGDFDTAWLHVVEQDDDWHVTDTWQDELRTMWAAEGRTSGATHRLDRFERRQAGVQQVDVLTVVRHTTPPGGRLATQSFDVYAPAGGRKVYLSFTCLPERFAAELPAFQRALATLTFARVAPKPSSLGDRLWSPILTGGAISVVLLVLYRYTRGRR